MISNIDVRKDDEFKVEKNWDDVEKLSQGENITITRIYSIRGTEFIRVNSDETMVDIPRYEFVSARNKNIIA